LQRPAYPVLRKSSGGVSFGVKARLLPHGVLLLCLVMMTAGCLPAGGMSGIGSPLPTASATLHWAKVDLPRGSYCWKFWGHGECADSARLQTLLQSGFLKPYRTAGGFDALVTFKSASQPSGFRVELQTADGKVKTIRESAPRTFSVDMIPRAASGIYVYVVTATWAEGNVSFYLVLDLIPGVA